MKIFVRDLPNQTAVVYEEALDPARMDLDIGVMRFTKQLLLRAEAFRSDDDLSVDVRVEGERRFTCSLCLEEFNNLFEKDIPLHYDIKDLEFVRIDQDVREELMLEHPIRVLCRPDCRGLCAGCGVNLNAGSCRCASAASG